RDGVPDVGDGRDGSPPREQVGQEDRVDVRAPVLEVVHLRRTDGADRAGGARAGSGPSGAREHQRQAALLYGHRRRGHLPAQAEPSVHSPRLPPLSGLRSEHADISFGGLGQSDGWTRSIVRTERGREIWDGAMAAGLLESKRALDEDPDAVALMFKLADRSRKRWPDREEIPTAGPTPGLTGA